MKTIGVIPARWGSTRLPGKVLQPLLGKPLVQWVLERAAQARCLDALIVATDDQRVFNLVRGATGAEAVMTRSDHPSGTDRVAEAVAQRNADLIVNIQGDEPLVDPGLIDRLVDLMRADYDIPMATAAVPIDSVEELQNPAAVKVVCDAAGRALYFSRAPIPFFRDTLRQPLPESHLRHLGLYVYRAGFLQHFVAQPPCALEQIEKLEQLRALYLGARIQVVIGADTGVAVDTPEDIPVAEAALRKANLAAKTVANVGGRQRQGSS